MDGDLEFAVALQEHEIEEWMATKGEASDDRISQVNALRDLISQTVALELEVQFQELGVQEYADHDLARREEAQFRELRSQEHADHNMARREAELPPLPALPPLPPLPPPPTGPPPPTFCGAVVAWSPEDGELVDHEVAQLKSPGGNRSGAVPDGRGRAAHPLAKDVEATCEACRNSSRVYIVAPCPSGHVFCAACVRSLFEHGIADRSLLPIKCCRVEWDQNLAKLVLPAADFDKLAQILYEERTENKMYCTNSKCSIFIDLDILEAADVIDALHQFTCPSCDANLCASCKVATHTGLTCAQYQALPEDEREDATLHHLARAEGLSRCARCRRVVELVHGCNHMTCICGYEFCYPCRQQWKTCACPLWDEARIVAAGQQRAGRGAPVAEVAQAIRQIRDQEVCAPHTFIKNNLSRRNGSRHCANCGFEMWSYKYKCSECELSVCHTCRFHRLG